MMQESKGEKAKEHLVECAASLFLKDGYNATGINRILQEAGMSKGSFYFYFDSKKALAMAVAEFYNEKLYAMVSQAASGRAWESFASELAGVLIRRAGEDKVYGCPHAVLGMEITFMEPDVASAHFGFLKNLKAAFQTVIERSGYAGDEAAVLADRAFAIYEGYLLLYRISRDICYLEMLLRDLKEIAPEK